MSVPTYDTRGDTYDAGGVYTLEGRDLLMLCTIRDRLQRNDKTHALGMTLADIIQRSALFGPLDDAS